MAQEELLTIGNRTLSSRLLLGSALYPNQNTLFDAIDASGSQVVTVSIRRYRGESTQAGQLFAKLRNQNIHILPNTAGCYTASEAVLTARLSREALGTDWIKLEIIGDEDTLYPDITELLAAAAELIRDGFAVLPYCTDDPVSCRKLADMGCAAVMPLGSPIGSGMGILNPYNIEIIRSQIDIPIILDAGIGTPSDAALAMELGCDGVLVNTAIAQSQNPVMMAEAMKMACIAGRKAYISGCIPKKKYAEASSPTEDMICR